MEKLILEDGTEILKHDRWFDINGEEFIVAKIDTQYKVCSLQMMTDDISKDPKNRGYYDHIAENIPKLYTKEKTRGTFRLMVEDYIRMWNDHTNLISKTTEIDVNKDNQLDNLFIFLEGTEGEYYKVIVMIKKLYTKKDILFKSEWSTNKSVGIAIESCCKNILQDIVSSGFSERIKLVNNNKLKHSDSPKEESVLLGVVKCETCNTISELRRV